MDACSKDHYGHVEYRGRHLKQLGMSRIAKARTYCLTSIQQLTANEISFVSTPSIQTMHTPVPGCYMSTVKVGMSKHNIYCAVIPTGLADTTDQTQLT